MAEPRNGAKMSVYALAGAFDEKEKQSREDADKTRKSPRRALPARPERAATNEGLPNQCADVPKSSVSFRDEKKMNEPPPSRPQRANPPPPNEKPRSLTAPKEGHPEMAFSTFRVGKGNSPIMEKEEQADEVNEDKREKMRKTRKNVLEELVNTERSYVEALFLIEQLYLKPLRQFCENKDPIISDEEISNIFSHIPTMINISRKLLQGLRQRLQDWDDSTCVGDVLMTMLPFMKMYSEYQVQYKTGLDLVIKLKEKNPRFLEFCNKCLDDPRSNQLDLVAYLIMPVQRIPRYLLLLENLVKHTWKDHVDFPDLCKSLELVKSVAGHVDAKDADKMLKLQEIQAKIGNETLAIIQPWRSFIKEKNFRVVMHPRNSDSKCKEETMCLYLFNDIGIFTSQKQKGKEKLKSRFQLCYCWVWDKAVEGEERDTGAADVQTLLIIHHPTTWYEVIAGTREDRDAWLSLIASTIDNLWETDNISRDRRARLTGGINNNSSTRKTLTLHSQNGQRMEWDPMKSLIEDARQIDLLVDLIDITKMVDEKDDERIRNERRAADFGTESESESDLETDSRPSSRDRESSSRLRVISTKKKLKLKGKSKTDSQRDDDDEKHDSKRKSDDPGQDNSSAEMSQSNKELNGSSNPENVIKKGTVNDKASLFEQLQSPVEAIKTGMLIKKGAVRKNWKTRYFVLDSDAIRYYKSSLAVDAVGCIFLRDCKVTADGEGDAKKKSYPFQLASPARTYFLRAKNEEERDSWVKEINEQLDKLEHQNIIKAGYLYKQGQVRKNWKRRYCVLDSRTLSYFKSENDQKAAGNVQILHSFVDWANERELLKESNRGRTVRVVASNRVFLLYGESEQASQEWYDTLRVVSRQFEAAGSSAKKSDHPFMTRQSMVVT